MIVMRVLKAVALVMAVVIARCLVFVPSIQAGGGFVPLVTHDALQSFSDPKNDDEITLKGNQTSLFTGQFLNAFSAPNSVSVSFNSTTDSTTVEFAGPAIAQNMSTFYTFGFAINAVIDTPRGPIVDPEEECDDWTPPSPTIPAHLPTPNIAAQYLTASDQVAVTISNVHGTVSLSSVGYLVTSTPFALTSLNRTALPPGAFIASGVPDGTTLTPGGSTTYTISGVDPGQYVTLFTDSQFSGASAGNPYTGLSGSWLEFEAVPEPASWVLMVIGVGTVLGRVAIGRLRYRKFSWSIGQTFR
jgi:hypothetical protein